jgi:hypothetical protein
MARFTIHITPAKRKTQRTLVYILIAGVLLFFLFELIGIKTSYPSFFMVMIGLGIFAPVYAVINLMGKVKYADIDADTIAWDTYDNKQIAIFLEWEDIQWVKKESDGSVTFFQSSSFDYNLPLVNFSEEDQRQLIELVLQYAQQYNIRVVNFSEPAQAVMA